MDTLTIVVIAVCAWLVVEAVKKKKQGDRETKRRE